MGLLRDLGAVLVFLFAVSVVSADVSISNVYYTNGCEAHEDVFLHNMDYANGVSINQAGFSASSDANISDQNENSSIKHAGYMESFHGMQGASLNIDAERLRYSRSMSGGNVNSLSFRYLADSGTVNAEYFTPSSTTLEDLTLVNNSYEGNFGVYDAKSFSLGEGESAVNESSSFKHNLTLTYLGRFCEINANFSTEKNYNENVNIPVSYEWTGFSFQRNYAVAGIKMTVTPGNRAAEFGIAGRSSVLEDKFSPDKEDKNETYPARFDDSAIGVNKTLIMQYKINQSGLWL